MSENLYTTEIIVSLEVPALHRWPDAPPAVAFLANPHRHVFHITCYKVVSHDDREIEIITFKREVEYYLHSEFDLVNGILNFNTMSCEQLAKMLCIQFELVGCQVLEDNENGAFVEKVL